VTARGSNVTYKGKALDVIQVSQELAGCCSHSLREPGWKE
jgi:hypothetical protein